MVGLIDTFLPSLPQALGLVGIIFVAAAMLFLGAIVGGTRRLVEADLLTGWAVLTLAVILIGVPAPIPLYVIVYTVFGLAVLAAIYIVKFDDQDITSDVFRLLAIGASVLVLASTLAPALSAEFSNWLPNARYLFENDVFPRTNYPAPVSLSPADPHGLAIVMYAVSLVSRGFAENAGTLFNALLLLTFAHLLARVIRMAIALPKPNAKIKLGLWVPMTGAHGWAYCAVGALAVTILNPAFSPGITFSATADSATAVVFGFGVVIAWTLLDAMGRGDEVRARTLAWQLGLSLVVLVSLRDSNLALFVILLSAIALVVWRDAAIAPRAVSDLLAYITVPPLLLIGAWKLHINVHLSDGTFDLLPIDQWAIEIAPDILSRMGLIATDKAGFFCVMVVAVAFGVHGLAKVRGSFDRLAILAGMSCLLYQLYLLFAYVTAYGVDDALRAASYWRFTTHLGGAGVAFATYGGALLWREHLTTRLKRNLGWIPVGAAVAVPFAYIDSARYDGAPTVRHLREVGADLAAYLPEGSRLAVVDPADAGANVATLRYELNRRKAIVAKLTGPGAGGGLLSALDKSQISHAWVHSGTGDVERALNLALPPGASHLLSRNGTEWRIVRSWPHAKALATPESLSSR